MRTYVCHVVDGGELMMSLQPAVPGGGKKAQKSWYLRAEDESSFETWRWAFEAAGAPAEGDAMVSAADAAGPNGAARARSLSLSTVRM